MLSDILKSIEFFKTTKKLDLMGLPSQSLFYKPNFWIKIKKVDIDDIIYYKHYYRPDNAIVLIELIKTIVKNNTFYPKGYSFDDVRSIDVVYIFLKLIEYTNKKPLVLKSLNRVTGFVENIPVTDANFNYFIPSDKYKFVNGEYISPNGFKFKIPTIKVEDCLTKFLTLKYYLNQKDYIDANYDFIYFLGDKNTIADTEIESLLEIFDEMSSDEKQEISSIVDDFKSFSRYSLIFDGVEHTLDGRLDLENAFDI